jgi:tetratricopeptide (TPR) repeat protein
VRRGSLSIGLAALVAAVLRAGPAAAQDPKALDLPGFEDVSAGYEAIEAWRYDTAREVAADLWSQRAEDPLVMALMAEVKLHHGDYRGALEMYEQADRAGAPRFVLRNRALAEAARTTTEDYAEVAGDRFVIRHAPGRDAILRPWAFDTLERSLEKLSTYFGFSPEGRILVEFYPSAQTLAQVSSLSRTDIENSGTIALCKWNRLMVTTPRGVVFGYAWRDTLSHELAHLLIGGASRNRAPIWLHEGLAKYVETAWRAEPGLGISVEQQKALRRAAVEGELIPFEAMHPSMAKLPTQEQTSLAFAEVFTFIEFLVKRKGWSAIRKTLGRMGEGLSDQEALQEVYGLPFAELESRWRASLPDRPIHHPADGRLVKGARRIELKEQPDSPDDELAGLDPESRRYARAADLLYTRGRVQAALVELRKAHTRSPSAQLAGKLAQVALQAGDLETAEAAARDAVDSGSGLAGPNVTLAQILVRQNEPEAAREALQRAVDVNPFDPRIHRAIVDLEENGGDPEALAQARRALRWMAEPPRPVRPSSGTGARIRVHGPPMARVFIARKDGPFRPTRSLSPTPVLDVRPGPVKIRWVPPVGPAVERTFEVRADLDRVQVLGAEPTGS